METYEESALSFAELLEQYDYPQPQRGEILYGQLLRIEDDVLYIDVGAKRDAMVPHEEVRELEPALLDSLSRGDRVPVYVVETPVGDEPLLVSLDKGLAQRDWEKAQELMEKDETLELEVVGHNKGGLLVQFNRIRGFVPNSHEPELRRMNDRRDETSYKARMLGEVMPLKIIEIDESRERLVLSATAAHRDLREDQLDELSAGDIVKGRVVNIVDYGAFLDLGYVTGLLHISKMAWEKIDHPADIMEIGDEIEVLVDSVDENRERISLNRQALLPSPWQKFADEHETGELIEGAVTALVDFGAFVEVAPGIEGLIHISEMPAGNDPGTVLQPGDSVLTRIVSLDIQRERLGLSMNRVTREEEVNWMVAAQSAASIPEGRVHVS